MYRSKIVKTLYSVRLFEKYRNRGDAIIAVLGDFSYRNGNEAKHQIFVSK